MIFGDTRLEHFEANSLHWRAAVSEMLTVAFDSLDKNVCMPEENMLGIRPLPFPDVFEIKLNTGNDLVRRKRPAIDQFVDPQTKCSVVDSVHEFASLFFVEPPPAVFGE